MTDTPEHIKKLQLSVWLSKTPSERLEQFLRDNETFFKMMQVAKKKLRDQNAKPA